MSDRNEEPLYEGRLSGTTFENRQEILAALKTSADRTTIGVLRESVEYDGVEFFVVRHKEKMLDKPVSLGWIPAKNPDEQRGKGPTPTSPLTLLRTRLDELGFELDDEGIYVGAMGLIDDIPRGGKTYGCCVSVWDVREDP